MSKKKGLTIIELMVASTILVMLLGGFLTAFNSLLNMANYSEGLSFAHTACLSQLEGIINQDFNTITAQGESWTFTPDGFRDDFQPSGNVTVTDQPALYGGEWTVVTTVPPIWSPRTEHASLVYDNRMWVLGGCDLFANANNEVWFSTNGINWTQAPNAPWDIRFSHVSLVYNNRMWVIGGYNQSDIWYSNNGINWTQAGSQWWLSGRYGHAALVYDNKMWVMGGYFTGPLNDIWYSSDGINWTQATTNPPIWSGRFSHTALVYDNKMWVMGGYFAGPLNDVWYSTDGINWTEALPNIGRWPVRDGHTSLVYDNKMWVMGGYFLKDVWYSTDGAHWWSATDAADWPGRSNHTSLVYDNKMWVLGGETGVAVLNDVWNSSGYDRLLEVVITVCWQHPNGRMFGEDANLNGVWDAGEDTLIVNNGLDSPVQLRILLSEKNMSNLRKIFLGRP